MINLLKTFIIIAFTCIFPLCVSADENPSLFCHIDWNSDFKTMPCFTHTIDLGANYADYDYSVRLEYPEYVLLTSSEIDSLRKFDLFVCQFDDISLFIRNLYPSSLKIA